jgi:4-aminobutyrate aminotransferase
MSTHLSNVWFKVTELEVVSGSGCTVTTAGGEEYLDFSSGIAVTSTGHCHPRVVAAIRDQAGRFIHAQANVYRHPLLEQLATRLAGVTPAGIDTFFFANSGAEATEAAVKLARQATKRPNVIVMDGAFHGRTMMAMAMTTSKTSYRAGYQPLPAGVFVAPFPRPYEWKVDEKTATERSLRALERLLAAQTAPNETAAIVIEPVLGEGGYLPAPKAYLQGVREICDETGILFVADEVQSGFARTGRMFAVEQSDVVPDIIVMAKGIASGFPIAGIGAPAELMGQWPQGAHGGTYGGNPIGCAAALATIDEMERLELPARAERLGEELVSWLAPLRERSDVVDVRGRGLCWAVQLRDASRAKAVVRRALERGFIFLQTGVECDAIAIAPPLVIADRDLQRAAEALRDAIAEES